LVFIKEEVVVVANITETIKAIEVKYSRKDLPNFNVGDTVKMKVKVQESDKVRLHPFEGTVIRKTGRGQKGSFTVRKISFGEGVERIFPLHSPVIESLTVVSRGDVKRSKLYYIRHRAAKDARIKKLQEVSPKEQVATANV
jgi:large subunit ribosomal protein L19